jgi:hypothetical protein
VTLLLYQSDADDSPRRAPLGDNPDPCEVQWLEAAYRAQGLDVVRVATEDEERFVETRKK